MVGISRSAGKTASAEFDVHRGTEVVQADTICGVHMSFEGGWGVGNARPHL